MMKNILLEIVKYIYKLANLQNASVTNSPQLLTSQFSLEIKDSKI